MTHEEFEFKFRVEGEAALERLIAAVAPGSSPEPVLQVNHFFDTEEHALRRRHLALRLREEANRWFLTAKGADPRQRADDLLAIKAEVEIEVSDADARAILARAKEPLDYLTARAGDPIPALLPAMREVVADAPLEEVGAFRNTRRRVGPITLDTATGALDVLFELDRTEFPATADAELEVHHEIEVELAAEEAERGRAPLLALLERAGIAWRHSDSKAKRFFRRLDADS